LVYRGLWQIVYWGSEAVAYYTEVPCAVEPFRLLARTVAN